MLNLREKIDYVKLGQVFEEPPKGPGAWRYIEPVFDFLKNNDRAALQQFIQQRPKTLKRVQQQLQQEYGRSTVLCYRGFAVADPEIPFGDLNKGHKMLRRVWEKGEGTVVTCQTSDKYLLSHWTLLPHVALQFSSSHSNTYFMGKARQLTEDHGFVLEAHIPMSQIVYMQRVMSSEIGGQMGPWASKEQEVVVFGAVGSCRIIKKI